jgi:hypothetical protein
MPALGAMAESARLPGMLETRVNCPVCGGLIHPVAGRCKHCKADLAATRTGRAPAAAPLPPLHANHQLPVNAPIVAATYISPVPIALPLHEGSAPILPPRPTGRSQAAAPRSALRNWPVVVIGLAAVAIIAAVAIMVWPQSKKDRDPQRALQPPPAPERMDSDPLPPSAPDSWAGHSQVTPPPPSAAPQMPLIPPGGFGDSQIEMMMAVTAHACARLTTCPNVDDVVRMACQMLARNTPNVAPPTCDAAKECLDAIDRLGCSDAATSAAMMTTIPSCVKAGTSC